MIEIWINDERSVKTIVRRKMWFDIIKDTEIRDDEKRFLPRADNPDVYINEAGEIIVEEYDQDNVLYRFELSQTLVKKIRKLLRDEDCNADREGQ